MVFDILGWGALFIVALYVLVKASDTFTDSAEAIGLKYGIAPFIVGVTIVAFGTSLPELVSSIFAVIQGNSEIVVGNVVGSNIANIALVLAIAAIMSKKLVMSREIIKVDLPLLIASSAILTFLIIDGNFDWIEGIICLAGILIYTLYTIKSSKRSTEKKTKKQLKKINEKYTKWTWPKLIGGAFFVFLGAKLTIDSVIELSTIFNIGTEIIAVVAVALGTSLPELMVTISAARKGAAEIAIGNILGSNIFNTFFVMGIPALIAPFLGLAGLAIPMSILTFALPAMITITFLYLVSAQDNELTQWEGWMFLLIYVIFILKTVL